MPDGSMLIDKDPEDMTRPQMEAEIRRLQDALSAERASRAQVRELALSHLTTITSTPIKDIGSLGIVDLVDATGELLKHAGTSSQYEDVAVRAVQAGERLAETAKTLNGMAFVEIPCPDHGEIGGCRECQGQRYYASAQERLYEVLAEVRAAVENLDRLASLADNHSVDGHDSEVQAAIGSLKDKLQQTLENPGVAVRRNVNETPA